MTVSLLLNTLFITKANLSKRDYTALKVYTVLSYIHKQKPLFLWIFIQKMKEHFLWLRKKTGAQTEKKYCFLRYGMVNHMLPISKQCNVVTHKCGCFLLWLTLWTPYLHHKCAIFLAKKKPCEALSSWRNLLLPFLWHLRIKVHSHHHWLLINSTIFSLT